MRYILMLALLFTWLPAASAADDPITKRNNDANTPVLVKSPVMRPVPFSELEKIRGRRGK